MVLLTYVCPQSRKHFVTDVLPRYIQCAKRRGPSFHLSTRSVFVLMTSPALRFFYDTGLQITARAGRLYQRTRSRAERNPRARPTVQGCAFDSRCDGCCSGPCSPGGGVCFPDGREHERHYDSSATSRNILVFLLADELSSVRTAKSAACRTLHMRTTDCSRNLKKLRKRFEMVLLTVIHNDGTLFLAFSVLHRLLIDLTSRRDKGRHEKSAHQGRISLCPSKRINSVSARVLLFGSERTPSETTSNRSALPTSHSFHWTITHSYMSLQRAPRGIAEHALSIIYPLLHCQLLFLFRREPYCRIVTVVARRDRRRRVLESRSVRPSRAGCTLRDGAKRDLLFACRWLSRDGVRQAAGGGAADGVSASLGIWRLTLRTRQRGPSVTLLLAMCGRF